MVNCMNTSMKIGRACITHVKHQSIVTWTSWQFTNPCNLVLSRRRWRRHWMLLLRNTGHPTKWRRWWSLSCRGTCSCFWTNLSHLTRMPAAFSHVTSASTYVTCSWVSFSFALGSIVLQTNVSLWTLLILIWRLSFSFYIFALSFSFWISLWIVFWFSLWAFWLALGLHTVYFHWNWTFSSTHCTVCTQHHLLRPFCSAWIVEQNHLTYLCICGRFIDLKL